MPPVVGKSLLRFDGYEKVTGRAIYASDFKLPGMVYARVLRSPFPHARIRGIDSRRAESLTGVLAALTRENLNLQVASAYYGSDLRDQPIVALDKVRYEGEIVAAAAATEESIADEALKLIAVDYEELPSVVALEDALKDGTPLLHEKFKEDTAPPYLQRVTRKDPVYGKGATYIAHEDSNIFHHFRFERGDVGRGFEEADFVFEDTFFFPGAHHCAMEPHVSLANFEGNEVTIWSGVQIPFPLRGEIARILALPLSHVRVVVPYVGGGYGGGRGVISSILAAILSRMTRKPVRLVVGSDESFKTFCQPRGKITIKTGVKKDGAFLARQAEVYLIAGAYAHSMPRKVAKAGCRALGPYRIPHVRTDAYGVYTTTVPATALRGFGGQHVAFAYESHLDMIAHRLNIDPVALRMKNLLERGEKYNTGDTPMDCDLKKGLKIVADAIEWDQQRRSPEAHLGRFRGKGIACTAQDAGGTNKPSYAMVKIAHDGSILLSSASVEIGQGVHTALLQIVAQELSVSPKTIQVTEIDTQYAPYDSGTHSSSGILVMGQAVQKAARDARQQLLSAAASALEAQVEEVKLEEGTIASGERRLSFQEVMRLYFGDARGEIVGRGFFKVARKDETPIGYPTLAWEIGIAGAEVEVDKMTGEVKIIKYVNLGDAGKMINPLQCRGQEEGAVLFGIGQALFEELIYKDGKLANPNLVDYRLPKFRDLPTTFTSIILEEGGGSGPYGAKGMGEGGAVPVCAAICNAVYDAVGARMNEVPLKGERVWKVVEKHARRTDT